MYRDKASQGKAALRSGLCFCGSKSVARYANVIRVTLISRARHNLIGNPEAIRFVYEGEEPMASLRSMCAVAALTVLVFGPTQSFAALTDHGTINSSTASLPKYAWANQEHCDFDAVMDFMGITGGLSGDYLGPTVCE
jgi:hypothetical protein